MLSLRKLQATFGHATTAQAERSPRERVGGNKLFPLPSLSGSAGCGNGTERLLQAQQNDSWLGRWFTLCWATGGASWASLCPGSRTSSVEGEQLHLRDTQV